MSASWCDQVRESWIEALPIEARAFEASLAAPAREHVRDCTACQQLLRRWPLAVRALSELPRLAAPLELDSAVVAAWHAGARTERALRAVQRLARLAPPDELGDALDQPLQDAGLAAAQVTRASAPHVLDRLVHEELLDPAKARVRRHVGGLRRLAAPDALLSRVATELSRGRLTQARQAPVNRHGLRSLAARRVRVILAAAAAFALVALPIALLVRSPQAPSRPFRIERASSLGTLSPMTRGMLDAASSGLTRPERS